MKWIRWWGLGVFLFLALAMTALWVLVVDSIVKQKIEEEGTAAVGAKVELDHADLTLFPTGLSLTRLQVTNPNEPMTNAVEIAKLSMGLDGLLLLRRKVIIDEMIITGVKFGTVRTTSGAIDARSRGGSTELLPAERARLLEQLMGRLPADQSRALRAHLAGFNHKELAVLFGWSESIARHRIYRGLAALKAEAKESGEA